MFRLIVSTLIIAAILGTTALTTIPAPKASAASYTSVETMRWYKARARMESNGRMKGKADYKERPKRGTTEQRLQIEIEKAEANTTYDVFFNGDLIGSIETNGFGRGELNLRTAEFIRGGNAQEWQPIPEGFPTVVDGDEIEVGPAFGEFRER